MLLYNAQEMQLPSKMLPYEFETLTMRDFGMPELMEISRALHSRSWKHVVNALSAVLDQDVNVLTDGDFYALLSCQRFYGYKESPLQCSWKCGGSIFEEIGGLLRRFTVQDMKDMVKAYDEADAEERKDMTDIDQLKLTELPCSHHNVRKLTHADLTYVYLEDASLPQGLDFPRVDTLVDSLVAKEDDPDSERIIQAARWVKEGDSLDEKMEILASQPDLRLFERALQAELTIRHGVSQIIILPCSECGQLSEHSFTVGPETFFDV